MNRKSGHVHRSVSYHTDVRLFVWLEKETGRNGGIFTRQQLENEFTFKGERIVLVEINRE